MGIPADALRRRMLAAVATTSVVAVACGGKETSEPTSPSSSSTSASSTSSSTSSSSSSGSGSGSTTSSGGTAVTCTGRLGRECTDTGAVRRGSFSQIPGEQPDAALPPPVLDPTTGCAVKEEMMDGCCNSAVAGPFLDNGRCCWDFCQGACCGRPVRVDGIAVVADATERADWIDASSSSSAASLDGALLDAPTRAALVAAYTCDALTEHASIASFSLFALELLAVGAPPDLVADAHAAALDEIAHARTTFAIASALAGADIGPTALPVAAMSPKTDLAAIAADCVRDGCIGETVASLVAAEQARRATAPSIREALAKIAEDEARHAELAWRFVRWALGRGDAEVRDAVARAFACGPPSGPSVPRGVDAQVWEAHGRLSESDFAAVAEAAAREVVEPCFRALGLNPCRARVVPSLDGDDPHRGARRAREA